MAWVPPYPPTKGLTVSISHPTEDNNDGVVRYRVMCRFDPSTTDYEETIPNAPVSQKDIVHRIVAACNDVLVIRRFSEFDTVFRALAQAKCTPPLPPLPEKKIFGAKDPKFVEDRRASIEAFTRAVLKQPDLYKKPEFLHLIGFSSLQLWFALSGPDDEAPSDATVRAVFDVDSETIRSDVIQKAATAKSDAVRRSTGRLMHYAMMNHAGIKAFVYENTRVALTAVANKAEHDSTRYWIANAVKGFAKGSEAAKQLVGRGDVRDALLFVATTAQSQPTLRACLETMDAYLQHGTPGMKHLFVTEKVRQLLAKAIACFTTLEDVMACVSLVKRLIALIPEIPRCLPGLFAESDLHGALGLARDMAKTAGDAAAFDEVMKVMVVCQCDVAVAPAVATPMPCAIPLWKAPAAIDAATQQAKQVVSVKATTADDFLEDDFDTDMPATAAATTQHAPPPKSKPAVDDFLSDDDDVPATAPQPPPPKVQPPAATKASAVDDFLDD